MVDGAPRMRSFWRCLWVISSAAISRAGFSRNRARVRKDFRPARPRAGLPAAWIGRRAHGGALPHPLPVANVRPHPRAAGAADCEQGRRGYVSGPGDAPWPARMCTSSRPHNFDVRGPEVRPARPRRLHRHLVRPLQGARPHRGEAGRRVRGQGQGRQARHRRRQRPIAEKYKIRSVPTVMVFRGGQQTGDADRPDDARQARQARSASPDAA